MILSACLSVLFFCMWIQVDRLDFGILKTTPRKLGNLYTSSNSKTLDPKHHEQAESDEINTAC